MWTVRCGQTDSFLTLFCTWVLHNVCVLLLQCKGLPLPPTGRYKSLISSVPSRNLQQSGCTPLARQAGPAEGAGGREGGRKAGGWGA